MPVLERERIRDVHPPVGDGGDGGLEAGGDGATTPRADGGPPPVPPAFYWDDYGDGDGDGDDEDGENKRGRGAWGRRVFAIVGVVVLLSMVVSPVAANLLAGHTVR